MSNACAFALRGKFADKLPEGWLAEREREYLVLRRSDGERAPVGYKQMVPVPGEAELKEIGCTIQIVPVPADFAAEVTPGTLLRADRTGDELWVRNWQPGDRYHMAYGGGEHKLKTSIRGSGYSGLATTALACDVEGTRDCLGTRSSRC